MTLTTRCCPKCNSENHKPHTTYTVGDGEKRQIHHCSECGEYFSDTKNTPLEGLKKPLSVITTVLEALNEGMSINAACRVFHVGKKSIKRWLKRLGLLKEPLLLYVLCHQFIQLIIEGDELYTKVGKNKLPSDSEGWTIVLMERASRFILDLSCGKKDTELFTKAIEILALVIEQADDLSLITDGERRYGNVLFDICKEVIRTGEVGRPKTTLPEGVKVRVKNKGSQSHKRGPKRAKYQAPQKEHPKTIQNIEEKDIHANHVEAFNSALRRRLSCYRRKTNTYAKEVSPLQTRLDGQWVLHNFVHVHFTIKQVPAVALGVINKGLSWLELFRIQFFSPVQT